MVDCLCFGGYINHGIRANILHLVSQAFCNHYVIGLLNGLQMSVIARDVI